MSSSLPTPPPRMPSSMRDLNATMTPPRRQPLANDFARAASVLLSPAKLAKASPTRGLTLEIGDNLGQYDRSKSIQSAPVRPVRRLPAPPLPTAPATAIEEVAYTTFPCFTPSSAIPSRPLPKPPVSTLGNGETTPKPEPQKPMERQRPVRPLPVPIPKTEILSATHSPPEPTSITFPTSAPVSQSIPEPVPSPSVIASFPRPDTPPRKRRHYSASAKALKVIAPRKLHTSRSQPDLNIDVVQLHRQLVLNRSPIRVSLDCDSMSDEEYSEETTISDMLFQDAPEPRKKVVRGVHDPADENSNHADYAWFLSNRILYHQKAADGRVGSKWTREKNGKRYTEEDFGNIINALRSL